MNTKSILILSPHLDDSVLSCADHISDWIHLGYNTTIINVFSSYKTGILSPDAEQCLTEFSLKTVHQYETMRKTEDNLALRALGIREKQNLDLVDGGFRAIGTKPVYSTFSALFQGKILEPDIIVSTSRILSRYQKFDQIFVPMGLGNHVDHVILRKSAERTYPRDRLGYYADAPYLLRRQNWRLHHILSLLTPKISIKFSSPQKTSILRHYSSQLPRLFTTFPLSYPEILVIPNTLRE